MDILEELIGGGIERHAYLPWQKWLGTCGDSVGGEGYAGASWAGGARGDE